jgi:hypothetical protein
MENPMIEDDCGGLCFACRLTGLGFDEEQQTLVAELMQEAAAVGVSFGVSFVTESGMDALPQVKAAIRLVRIVQPEMFNHCIADVMEARSQPMSPEVAAAVRGSHQ